MTHATRFVAVVVLVALAACAPEVDELRTRAEQGDVVAQLLLGDMYDNGEGVAQDAVEAVRWFRLAAEQGDSDAQYNIGAMYAGGRGVPEDDAEAARWYRLAADQGLASAQFFLAMMYADFLVPRDDVQAHMWYNLAAPRFTGPLRESTVRRRDIVAGRMTAEQVAEAQRLAREWDAAHPR